MRKSELKNSKQYKLMEKIDELNYELWNDTAHPSLTEFAELYYGLERNEQDFILNLMKQFTKFEEPIDRKIAIFSTLSELIK